jgi:hypothetical protein
MAAEAGKGSSPRPFSVDQKTFDANWNAIFKKNESETVEVSEDKVEDHSEEDSQ